MATSDYKTLQEALVVALANMPDPLKNAENPAFKRDGKPMRYADLEATLDACKPILAAHGIALMQMPVSETNGLGVRTVLIGYGEQMDCGSFVLPLEAQTPQKGAGAITYARRYALTALFGLAQEDDDANAVSATEGRTHGSGQTRQEIAGTADDKVLKRIYAKRRGLGISDDAFIARLREHFPNVHDRDSDMTASQADNVLKRLIEAEKAEKAGDSSWRQAWPEPDDMDAIADALGGEPVTVPADAEAIPF